jgi:hypothetical protein
MASGRQIEAIVPQQLRGMTPVHGARNAIKQVELRRILYGVYERGEQGAVLEFGVGSGATFANLVEFVEAWDMPNKCYGFDSFQGLPKDEGIWGKGMFTFTREYTEKAFVGLTNYRLIPGFFDESLTPELREELQLESASLVLVDSDLYSSAVTVLEWVKPLILPGTYVVFDEWPHGEKEAWEEFVDATKLQAEEIPSQVPEQKVFCVGSI